MLSFVQTHKTFFVEETLAYQPSGQGSHLFGKFKKIGISTFDLKRKISEITGTPLREIRHAGKKDRDATATQWLSWPKSHQKTALQPEGGNQFDVLELVAHEHALAVGHVKSNAFKLVLHLEGDLDVSEIRNRPLVFTNFFGPQRFGSGPSDFSGDLAPVKGFKPGKERISVVQAMIFNALLRARDMENSLLLEDDEIWMHAGSKRFFHAPLDDDIQERYKAGLVFPSGPMMGYKVPLRQSELDYLQTFSIEQEDFRQWGKAAKGARRALFAKATDFKLDVLGNEMHLSFELPTGAYATVFLTHLLSPDLLSKRLVFWPNFTKKVCWKRSQHGFEMAVV